MSILSSTAVFEKFGKLTGDVTLTAQSSYDEVAVCEKILATGEKETFRAIALQLSIVGFSSVNFGKVFLDGDAIEIEDFFEEHGVIVRSGQGAKLKQDDLTPKRIIRVFRYHIREYLNKEKDVTSFLVRKYLINHNTGYDKNNMFIGCEHLITADKDIEALLYAYNNLDENTESGFVASITNVLTARGLHPV
jgi:hypothetical protein